MLSSVLVGCGTCGGDRRLGLCVFGDGAYDFVAAGSDGSTWVYTYLAEPVRLIERGTHPVADTICLNLGVDKPKWFSLPDCVQHPHSQLYSLALQFIINHQLQMSALIMRDELAVEWLLCLRHDLHCSMLQRTV